MLLKDYVFWDRGVPSHVCDQIVKYGARQPSAQGQIANYNKRNLDTKIRDSDVGWLRAPWILDWIQNPALQGNRDIFKYNINGLETIQFTKYTTGQHYDWHIDMADETTSNQSRKLSMVIPLTDPSEYTGGELEIQSLRSAPEGNRKLPSITKKEFKAKGTKVLFPSHVWHRVKPVTKGIRYSLVGWWVGPLFT